MEYILIYLLSVLISVIWLVFEGWRAPLLDKDYKVMEKEKTFSDLLKKLKLWK
jgi:hypothetical protein